MSIVDGVESDESCEKADIGLSSTTPFSFSYVLVMQTGYGYSPLATAASLAILGGRSESFRRLQVGLRRSGCAVS